MLSLLKPICALGDVEARLLLRYSSLVLSMTFVRSILLFGALLAAVCEARIGQRFPKQSTVSMCVDNVYRSK